jgi:hypothetical protein
MSGQWISIAAADGNASRAYLAIPEAGQGPGLVLLEEKVTWCCAPSSSTATSRRR